MFLCKRKAQGILEYTLLLGAIVAVVVVVLMSNGGLAGKTKALYDKTGNSANTVLNRATGDLGVMNGVQ